MMHSGWNLFLTTVALCLLAWPVHSRVQEARLPSSVFASSSPLHSRGELPGRPPARNQAYNLFEDRPVLAPRGDAPRWSADDAALEPNLQEAQPTLHLREAVKQPVISHWSDDDNEDNQFHNRASDQALDRPIALSGLDTEPAEKKEALGTRADKPSQGPHRPTSLDSSDDEPEDQVDSLHVRSESPDQATAVNGPASKHLVGRPPLDARQERPTTMYDADAAFADAGHPPAFSRRNRVERIRVFRD
ncbi:hypothetical protein HRG_006262 [Hirsutella rhossiliensis]|uniref:Secreted protein n=1 Tax=Hirsutella rhossiliensis TaxID=111463 RepID=A0A9P8MVT6_9HYPO|nr:uncharacterized protein HRG_06262 [Hirsutella rhossiliensis]KAH0962160.1 hypothetical protein HRG_06262 [Hirsutella rhossiliensis]